LFYHLLKSMETSYFTQTNPSKKDKQFIMEAVKQNPYSLNHADESLKKKIKKLF